MGGAERCSLESPSKTPCFMVLFFATTNDQKRLRIVGLA